MAQMNPVGSRSLLPRAPRNYWKSRGGAGTDTVINPGGPIPVLPPMPQFPEGTFGPPPGSSATQTPGYQPIGTMRERSESFDPASLMRRRAFDLQRMVLGQGYDQQGREARAAAAEGAAGAGLTGGAGIAAIRDAARPVQEARASGMASLGSAEAGGSADASLQYALQKLAGDQASQRDYAGGLFGLLGKEGSGLTGEGYLRMFSNLSQYGQDISKWPPMWNSQGAGLQELRDAGIDPNDFDAPAKLATWRQQHPAAITPPATPPPAGQPVGFLPPGGGSGSPPTNPQVGQMWTDGRGVQHRWDGRNWN